MALVYCMISPANPLINTSRKLICLWQCANLSDMKSFPWELSPFIEKILCCM